MIALFGGAFDPPHVGHVRLAETAVAHFSPDRLLVLVSAAPWHRAVVASPEERLELARAAFRFAHVELDPHPSTVELLEARGFADPLFLIGADQLAALPTWREPDRVLELARLGVATRPGVDLDAVLARVTRSERVLHFELEPTAVSSTEIRERVALGEAVDGLVPPGVAERIAALGLYRGR